MILFLIQKTISLTGFFVDAAGAPLSGLTPQLRLSFHRAGHTDDGKFFDGAGWVAAPADVAMTAVDAVNRPGLYRYLFTLRADAVEDGAYYAFRIDAGATATPRYIADTIAPLDPFRMLAPFLDGDLGTAAPAQGSAREALMAARAHAMGTRRRADGKREEILMPDRSTVLATRDARPKGDANITSLVEVGDFVLKVGQVGEITVEGLDATDSAHGVLPPVGEITVEGLPPTTPLQVQVGEITVEGLDVTLA